MGDGFQPAGRAAAPAPLDLVQDFVNTEIPEWARDDIATPELLAGWLRERSLLGPDEPVSADDFVAARELRSGTVGHNSFRTDFNIAFGGFKQSGIGRELGPHALDHYTEVKNVFVATGG